MKIFQRGLFLLLLTIFLSGCQISELGLQQTQTTTLTALDLSQASIDIEQDARAYFGKVIALEDFPSSRLLALDYEEKIQGSIESNAVGSSPEKALVLVRVDDNHILYTPTRSNIEDEKVIGPALSELSRQGIEVNETVIAQLLPTRTEYLTDLETYRLITGVPQATKEYTNALANASGQAIRYFDAYVKFFEKSESYERYRDDHPLEDVSQVSLQRLAQMHYDTSVDESLYEDIDKRISSLSQQEYDTYLSYWIELGVQKMIDKDIITEQEREKVIAGEVEEQKEYNSKSRELFGVPMYKLDIHQKIKVLEALKSHTRT